MPPPSPERRNRRPCRATLRWRGSRSISSRDSRLKATTVLTDARVCARSGRSAQCRRRRGDARRTAVRGSAAPRLHPSASAGCGGRGRRPYPPPARSRPACGRGDRPRLGTCQPASAGFAAAPPAAASRRRPPARSGRAGDADLREQRKPSGRRGRENQLQRRAAESRR